MFPPDVAYEALLVLNRLQEVAAGSGAPSGVAVVVAVLSIALPVALAILLVVVTELAYRSRKRRGDLAHVE